MSVLVVGAGLILFNVVLPGYLINAEKARARTALDSLWSRPINVEELGWEGFSRSLAGASLTSELQDLAAALDKSTSGSASNYFCAVAMSFDVDPTGAVNLRALEGTSDATGSACGAPPAELLSALQASVSVDYGRESVLTVGAFYSAFDQFGQHNVGTTVYGDSF